ncbi:MAG: YihA family ribosome biogenesis GTP-binding protein [Bryobacteraceae bacterium]|nr:YihA family ribosome biogenesis GTP-binding protein [Bryobacteraceae bacterium]
MQAEFMCSAARPEDFPPERLPEIAFLGRSNVGKSSVLNRLVGAERLAFTSSTPGRTQTLNFYRIENRLCFVDLPGYGFARTPKTVSRGWKHLVEAYLGSRKVLELSVLLLDVRRGWMKKDLELRQWLEFHNRRYLVVATKIDKLNHSELRRGLSAIRNVLAGSELVAFSALTGQGVRELWQAIWRNRNQR